ncbi:hypothetical protein TWF481_011782 [Arthrobotrys musiformis]|uniref:Uncharacterized protein n=1 Tax=Arthrobotrys musiformis TaxID=47236 RepID=A0AAV9VX44_9PEZI
MPHSPTRSLTHMFDPAGWVDIRIPQAQLVNMGDWAGCRREKLFSYLPHATFVKAAISRSALWIRRACCAFSLASRIPYLPPQDKI